MQDEWDFQRIRRFMDEQAAMTASSVFYMNVADFIRQLPASPYEICSTMTFEVATTNSRLKAPAAAVELQPVQQSSSITSYMACQPSMNRSFEMPATDQSNRLQSPCTQYRNSLGLGSGTSTWMWQLIGYAAARWRCNSLATCSHHVLVSNMWIPRIFNCTIWQMGNHTSHTVHFMHACMQSRAL
jgi:hypothetical protein